MKGRIYRPKRRKSVAHPLPRRTTYLDVVHREQLFSSDPKTRLTQVEEAVRELVKKGLMEDSGIRRDGEIVWRATKGSADQAGKGKRK